MTVLDSSTDPPKATTRTEQGACRGSSGNHAPYESGADPIRIRESEEGDKDVMAVSVRGCGKRCQVLVRMSGQNIDRARGAGLESRGEPREP